MIPCVDTEDENLVIQHDFWALTVLSNFNGGNFLPDLSKVIRGFIKNYCELENRWQPIQPVQYVDLAGWLCIVLTL